MPNQCIETPYSCNEQYITYVNVEEDCTYKMIYFPLTMNKAANATVATIQISLDSSKSKHSPWTQTWVLAGHGNVRLQIGFCDSTMILPLPPVPEGPGGGGRRRWRRRQRQEGYVGAEFFSFSNNDNWLACSQALKKMSARWEFIDRAAAQVSNSVKRGGQKYFLTFPAFF